MKNRQQNHRRGVARTTNAFRRRGSPRKPRVSSFQSPSTVTYVLNGFVVACSYVRLGYNRYRLQSSCALPPVPIVRLSVSLEGTARVRAPQVACDHTCRAGRIRKPPIGGVISRRQRSTVPHQVSPYPITSIESWSNVVLLTCSGHTGVRNALHVSGGLFGGLRVCRRRVFLLRSGGVYSYVEFSPSISRNFDGGKPTASCGRTPMHLEHGSGKMTCLLIRSRLQLTYRTDFA